MFSSDAKYRCDDVPGGGLRYPAGELRPVLNSDLACGEEARKVLEGAIVSSLGGRREKAGG